MGKANKNKQQIFLTYNLKLQAMYVENNKRKVNIRCVGIYPAIYLYAAWELTYIHMWEVQSRSGFNFMCNKINFLQR